MLIMMQSMTPFRVVTILFLATVLTGCLSQPPHLSAPLKTAVKKKAISTLEPEMHISPKQGPQRTLVAVILPQTGPTISLASSAIHNGIETARRQNGTAKTIRTRYYYTIDDTASPIVQYQRAVNDGAAVVIGPLTKIAIDNLIHNITITLPTFLLNTTSQLEKLPPMSYVMSLSIEEESREMAETMHINGYPEVIIVYIDSILSRRIGQAFATQWRKRTDTLAKAIVLVSSHADITELKKLMNDHKNAGVFLAMTASEAANIVPKLQSTHSFYGISQIVPDKRHPAQQHALKGIKYADIPLLLMPNKFTHYPHPFPRSLDLERFYALGIDVYQQVTRYLQTNQLSPIYDGAAGRWLKLESQVLKRQLPIATIGQPEFEVLP